MLPCETFDNAKAFLIGKTFLKHVKLGHAKFATMHVTEMK
jgi:hypothetical protein